MRLHHKIKYFVGFSFTALCLFVLYKQVNPDEVVLALVNFDSIYLIAGAASLAVGYTVRIGRWCLLLKSTGAQVGFTQCIAPFLGSIALNNVLPLRLGDVIRVLVFPSSMGIKKSTATSSLVIERLVDLVTLVLCLAIGLSVIQSFSIPEKYQALALILAFSSGGLLLAGILFSSMLSLWFNKFAWKASSSEFKTKICKILAEFFSGLNLMSKPQLLSGVLLLSMMIWIGEAGFFYFVLSGFGFNAPPAVALLIMALATLSTLVPSSPGYVGPFHLAVYTAATLVGVTNAQAVSYAVIVHLALWLLTTLLGVGALLSRPELFSAAKLRPV